MYYTNVCSIVHVFISVDVLHTDDTVQFRRAIRSYVSCFLGDELVTETFKLFYTNTYISVVLNRLGFLLHYRLLLLNNGSHFIHGFAILLQLLKKDLGILATNKAAT